MTLHLTVKTNGDEKTGKLLRGYGSDGERWTFDIFMTQEQWGNFQNHRLFENVISWENITIPNAAMPEQPPTK